MSDMIYDNIVGNLRDIDKNGTLLDILLEFEATLDKQGMYAYKNWKLGEIVEVKTITLLATCKTNVSIQKDA